MTTKIGQTSDWPYAYDRKGNSAYYSDLPTEFRSEKVLVADICNNLVYRWHGYVVGLTDHGTDHCNREYQLVVTFDDAVDLSIANSRYIDPIKAREEILTWGEGCTYAANWPIRGLK